MTLVDTGKTTAPKEAWAPGMTRALDDFKSVLSRAFFRTAKAITPGSCLSDA
jgi:hypothetical protein